jgi:hypothetical protein
MPTILRISGLRVVVYPNDHRPPHVHVLGAGVEAIFELNCPAGPVSLRGSYGFTTGQLRTVMEALNATVPALCAEWEKFHESDR